MASLPKNIIFLTKHNRADNAVFPGLKLEVQIHTVDNNKDAFAKMDSEHVTFDHNASCPDSCHEKASPNSVHPITNTPSHPSTYFAKDEDSNLEFESFVDLNNKEAAKTDKKTV